MVSFLIVWKIRSYLVRAKLYPLVRQVASFKCGGRHCQGCLDVTETGRLTSTSTNQTFKINHEFNCSESSLIYLLMCRVCRKQYVGQTADTLRSRWNNCKSNDRMLIIPVCKNTYLNILTVKVILVFYRMSPLRLMIKLTRKILKKRKLLNIHFKDHGTLELKYS